MATSAPAQLRHDVAGAGLQRADKFLILCLAIFRTIQLSQATIITIVQRDHYRIWWPVVATLVIVVSWAAGLYIRSYRLGRVRRSWFTVDVLLTSSATLLIDWLCLPGEVETWTNWAFEVGCNTAMLGALVLPAWGTLTVGGFIVIVGLTGAGPALLSGQASVSNAIGNSLTYAGLSAMAVLAVRYFRRTGRELDEANERAIDGEVARAADRARFEDRMTQYRTLHDTVLGTLTAISRGGLDPQLPEVQARASREADYLRRLLTGDVATTAHRNLHEALSLVIEDAVALGVRTRYLTDAVPADLPADIVAALAEASREALTNVARHARTNEAWLTSVGQDDGVVVRVTDQGTGFRPDQTVEGLGLQRSIRDRLTAIGGTATIESQPGDGTLVELRWSRAAAGAISQNGAAR